MSAEEKDKSAEPAKDKPPGPRKMTHEEFTAKLKHSTGLAASYRRHHAAHRLFEGLPLFCSS
jgi:hypothetical protein